MANKPLIAAVIGIVIALAIGGYVVMTKQKNVTQAPNTTTSTTKTTGSTSNSLRGLMGAGINQKCTYTDETGNTGALYVAGSKVRGDFTSMMNNKTYNSHMVTDGTTSYMWNEGETTGFKMAFDAASVTPQAGTNTPDSTAVDVDKKVDYNCSVWVVTNSMFDLPAGVEFRDFSAMMKNSGLQNITPAPNTGSENTTDQCAVCDSLPASAKEQCLASLGC